MKFLKQLLIASIISISMYESIKTTIKQSTRTPEPAQLKILKVQEKNLMQEAQSLHDSNLHKSKINLIKKIALAKTNKQAKIDGLPPTTAIDFETPEYWKRQIAITTTTIQGLQKLLAREQEGKDSSAKIHTDLKNEHSLASQDPEARNQTLES